MNTSASSCSAASSTQHLKRAHPRPNGNAFNALEAPPLPKIGGDLILQVFTHKSLRRQNTGNNPEDYGDNERLEELGKIALDAVVTHVLFQRRPLLKAAELMIERHEVLSDENFDDWVNCYGLRRKLRCHPDLFPSLNTPPETRSIFYAYVGGVYAESGPQVVGEWIGKLLQSYEPPQPSDLMPPYPIETPPPKKIKSEPPSQPTPIFFASQPPPSPVVRQPPPHIPMSSLPNPLAPAQPGLPFLPLFNQTATQRRVTVEYPAEFSGPSHAGRWTVQCVVNGIPKGVGTGSSKQVAKEEAARQAYYAMGWT